MNFLYISKLNLNIFDKEEIKSHKKYKKRRKIIEIDQKENNEATKYTEYFTSNKNNNNLILKYLHKVSKNFLLISSISLFSKK